MSYQRNLLFGILAAQMNFVSRDALLRALAASARDPKKSIGQIFLEHGELTPRRYQLLERLVEENLRANGNDPARSLMRLSTVVTIRHQLWELGDPTFQHSLEELENSCSGTTDPGPRRAAVNRYRVLRPYVRGGLGELFIAEDTELHREVALKEIQPQHVQDAQSLGRFLLEAEITGRLEHPGIIPVYGMGMYPDGRPYYAMRFIKGDSFSDAIKRHHQVPNKERNVVFRELLWRFVAVCNTVAYAHSRGVLHRDLKPANILLGQFGETLVVDWGLAKVLKPELDEDSVLDAEEATLRPRGRIMQQTMHGAILGTPAYMSPEQARGDIQRLSPASDVYSLGATLYALLTGQPPFTGGSPPDLLYRVTIGQFPPPRQIKPDVPPALEAIVLRAMAIEPEDRYPSATALAQDVERWLADEPVQAYPESPWMRFRRWSRRQGTLLTLVVALLLVAVLGSVVGIVVVVDQQRRRTEQARAAVLQELLDARVPQLLDQGESAEAVAYIRHLVSLGYRDLDRLKTEPSLTPLRHRDDFRQLLADLEQGQALTGQD